MTENPDHTRRWLINVSGAALLSNVLPAAPASAQGAGAAKPAAAAEAAEGRRQGRAAVAGHGGARDYISGALDRELPARGGGQDQDACARHHRRHDVRLAAQGRRRRRPLCGGAGRQAAGDRGGHRLPHLDRQCGARQRHGGPWRRDRRFPSQGPLPSGLRHRAGGARHRRSRRPQRQRSVARGRARLRHRGALDLCARLRGALYRAAQHPQPLHHLRRHRGGLRHAAARSDPGAPRHLVRGPAGLRRALLGARPRACREGVRFRRHGGEERRDRRHHGGLRHDRRRRSALRRQESVHGARRRQAAARTVRRRASASASRSSTPRSRNGASARRCSRCSIAWPSS